VLMRAGGGEVFQRVLVNRIVDHRERGIHASHGVDGLHFALDTAFF